MIDSGRVDCSGPIDSGWWRLLARRCCAPLLCLFVIAGALEAGAAELVRPEQPDDGKRNKHRKAADDFFAGPIVSVKIVLTPEQFEHLKKEPRIYVPGTLTEGTKTYDVAVKLKGSAGSFQNLDAKPGFSLNFERLKGVERFYGMKKIHLNNSVQDGTYLSELMGGAIGRQAGVPASRCTHAFVQLNGRDLGLYVVKEGFTKDFLSYFFKEPTGGLWDGGFCKDLEENMVLDQGGPDDKAALKALIDVCKEGDPAKRWSRLVESLDIERFAAFCVMEDFLCHWDGYNFNRNNYRLYREAETGKFTFFLHGMDQLFGDPNMPVIRDFGGMVGNAFIHCPEGAKLYRATALGLYEKIIRPIDWPARVSEEGERVRTAILAKNPQWAKEYQSRIAEERSRVEQRIAAIGKQLGELPVPFTFDANGVASLSKGWHEIAGGAARLDHASVEGKPSLHLVAENESAGSWRNTVHLEPGRYRLEANARVAGVQSHPDPKGAGAGLRISGATRTGEDCLTQDSGWRDMSFEFDSPGGDVVLVAELRATKGEAWFREESLRLRRLK